MPVTFNGVPGPPVARGKPPGTDGALKDGSGWRRTSVPISTVEEDDGTQQEHDGGEHICQPEADVLRPK